MSDTISQSIRNTTKEMEKRSAAFKESLKALVKGLPPHPDSEVIPISKNCVSVKFSALSFHNN